MPKDLKKSTANFMLCAMILTKYTSNETKLTLNDINKYLKNLEFKEISDSTFSRYIKLMKFLEETNLWNNFFGEVIIDTSSKMNTFGISTIFEDCELRILADLLYANKGLSDLETNRFIEKLSLIANVHTLELKRDGLKNKKTEFNISNNISNILRAIKLKKEISFNYREYNVNNTLSCKLENGEKKVYKAHPMDIFLKKDFYYLVLKRDNKEGYANYRIDKMCNITILDNDSIIDDSFNLVKHINQSVYMFAGDVYSIELEIDKRFRGLILDEFGRDVKIYSIGKKIIVDIENTIDAGLISWILQLGSACKVRKPDFLVEQIKLEVTKILNMYD